MKPIDIETVQQAIEQFVDQDIYIHIETTTGAYANHRDEKAMTVSAFLRNSIINFHRGNIKGNGPYRVGLKTANGWAYAEGLTHFEIDDKSRLLLAGHDGDGKLAVALQLSKTPFD